MTDALAWYVALQALALSVWPLAAWSMGSLADRGWAASKTLGLLLTAWIVWLLALLLGLPYARGTIVMVAGLLALGSWWVLPRRGGRLDLAGWLRREWRLVVGLELLFAAAYGFFALLRAYEPTIAGTEKPMDMAFLNGFIMAQRLPTADTWLAGYPTPYYYFGFFTFATLAKLPSTTAGIAYNLSAATVPALATVGLGGLAWNAARAANVGARLAALAAVLAPLLALGTGNLAPFLEWLYARGALTLEAGQALGVKNFAEGVLPGQWPPLGGWWFKASRVIPNLQPDGINEFPFFSAYLSDLHPHFMALPFEVLALAALLVHASTRGNTLRTWPGQVLSALTLGALLPLNTWDVAPFWALHGLLAFALPRCEAPPRRFALAAAAPVGGALLFSPYLVGYGGPPLGLGLVTERTPVGSMLVLFGPFLLLLLLLGVWMRWCERQRRGWLLAAGGLAAGAAMALLGQPTLGLLLVPFLVLLPWPGGAARLPAGGRFAVALGAFSLAVLLGVELIFLRDAFGTRMNTVFKFHYNAWLLGATAAALSVTMAAASWRAWRRAAVLVLAALVLGAGLVYPLSTVPVRLANPPSGGPTLDGLGFLPPADAAGVAWLRAQQRDGRVVIVEAVGGQYSSFGRMATYSGASAVLGWPGHELQWRGPLPELSRREADIRLLYTAADPETVGRILAAYGVRYVVVGDLERQAYGPDAGRGVEAVLPVAFRSGGLSIYRAR